MNFTYKSVQKIKICKTFNRFCYCIYMHYVKTLNNPNSYGIVTTKKVKHKTLCSIIKHVYVYDSSTKSCSLCFV